MGDTVTDASSAPAEKTSVGFGITLLIALILVIIIFASHKPATDIPIIQAAIGYFDSQVLIENKESVALKKCMVSIEANSTYYLEGIDIAVNETKVLDGELFTNADRERFNPYKYNPRSVSIHCDTANGERAGTKTFK